MSTSPRRRRPKEHLDNAHQVLYLYDGWQVGEERDWETGDDGWGADASTSTAAREK